jgi:AcrR family transcriptional regulator/DNA-binding MarR family transcriptional regulator
MPTTRRAPSPVLGQAEETAPSKRAQRQNGVGREDPVGHERVADVQRARMLGAMVEEVAERGAGKVSVAHVVARSGVSRRTFYEIFEDREDCFLAAFDEAVRRIAAVVRPSYEQGGGWQARTRAALTALLGFLQDDPGTGRLVIVESLAAGPRALEHRTRVVERVIAAIDEGRGASKADTGPPPLTAEGVVGGVLSVLHARLSTPPQSPTMRGTRVGGVGGDSLLGLVGPLMGMIVLPYLGPAAARKEIERPVPKMRPKADAVRSDPLRDLEMRLTYRTIRVLMAVAAHPGSSNRTIGKGAGIPDQGQASKLLARLHGLGLIENAGAGPARGEPNAWTLTNKGWEIHAAITQQTPAA